MDTTAVTSIEWITSTQAVAALVGLLTAGIIAVISSYVSYLYTRRTRLEAEWRVDKLNQYRDLLSALSGMVNWRSDVDFDQSLKDFARATNLISLVAPMCVLDAATNAGYSIGQLYKDKSPEADQSAIEAIRKLILSFRKDLKIKPKDKEADFKFVLLKGESMDTTG